MTESEDKLAQQHLSRMAEIFLKMSSSVEGIVN